MVLELVSFGDDAPSGANLEYETVFTELEIAAQPGEERQMGNEIVAAEEPDYADVIRKARIVLEQSHDLRAAIYLAHAELRRNGFPGFAEAVGYIRGCLSDFWDSCHPQLDEDDGDPTMRVNAVQGLAAPETMLRALRLAPIARSGAFGDICLRHKQIIEGEVSPSDSDEHVPDAAGFSAAFKDTKTEVMDEIIVSIQQAKEDIDAIDAVFDEKIPGQGPNLDELKKMMVRIVAVVSEETGVAVEEVAGEAGAASEAAAGAPAAAVGVPGAINSDRDVLAALEKITEYYARTQPSNPVPILLERARRLVGADFITIVKDLAPNGLDNVKLVGGITEDDGSGY
nr:type VI secretion system protein TssA [Tropicimonas sp. IMCC6043]